MGRLARAYRVDCFAALILGCLTAPIAAQGLVYVDGVDDSDYSPCLTCDQNIYPSAGGALSNAVIRDSSSTPGDNKWGLRGNGAPTGGIPTVYESITEISPELRQRVTGLVSGELYHAFVVYWSDGSDWAIRAGLTSNPGADSLFDRTGSGGATAGSFAGDALWAAPPENNPDPLADNDPSPFSEYKIGDPATSAKQMYVGWLGTVTAADGAFDVYVDDVSSFSANRRSWFDGVAYLPVAEWNGDYNGDGQVNVGDFTVWRDSMGQKGTVLAADGNLNGVVDYDDYAIWKSRFGQLTSGAGASQGSASGTTSIPEPSAVSLVFMGFGLAVAIRRHRFRLE